MTFLLFDQIINLFPRKKRKWKSINKKATEVSPDFKVSPDFEVSPDSIVSPDFKMDIYSIVCFFTIFLAIILS